MYACVAFLSVGEERLVSATENSTHRPNGYICGLQRTEPRMFAPKRRRLTAPQKTKGTKKSIRRCIWCSSFHLEYLPALVAERPFMYVYDTRSGWVEGAKCRARGTLRSSRIPNEHGARPGLSRFLFSRNPHALCCVPTTF